MIDFCADSVKRLTIIKWNKYLEVLNILGNVEQIKLETNKFNTDLTLRLN